MSGRINLADPSYEPTDADFDRLVGDAFGGLGEAREASLRAMHKRIERLRAEARAQFEARRRATSPT